MNADDPIRKKQLGQFFTGLPVARLLAALADAGLARSIIDPMVGSGDMLQACLDIGARPERMVGVELDPLAAEVVASRLGRHPELKVECRDAFSGPHPVGQFDLVITNPPYIRYQARADATGIDVPSGAAIRSNLMRAIDDRPGLSTAARDLFRSAAMTYPGTSDVAVPAWILAASLVAESGTLAVVVPQAWLSRNYAAAIRHMLDRAFDVEFLVEDGDASWFNDAQVRTHLLVARRRPISAEASGRRRVISARATRDLADGNGWLVGALHCEPDVAAALREIDGSDRVTVTKGLTAHIEYRSPELANRVSPRLMEKLPAPPQDNLATFGWTVGQGLRTGANEVFYLTRTPSGFATAGRWRHRFVSPPSDSIRPVVRRQSDLSDQLHVRESTLDTVVLGLREYARCGDLEMAIAAGVDRDWLARRYKSLPPDIASWLDEVSTTQLYESASSRLFPDLTAVAPNSRVGRSGEPLGYWYHLPKFAPRHTPAVFIPRVCGARPHAYANADRAIVDANFATLWPTSIGALPVAGMHALLNSTWVWAHLELTCNVLGGGALKVEATDLRALPLPAPDALLAGDLTRLGKALEATGDLEILEEVDWHVGRALGHSNPDQLTEWLGGVAREAAEHRSS